MPAKSKKVILFIVEGPTEEAALSSILKNIFQNKDVHFHVVHGDMTSERSVSNFNAIEKVYDYIKIECKRYGLVKNDIIKVIHLVDTDGVFVTADKVIFSKVKAILYFEDRIETAAPDFIVARNTRKSQVLRRLQHPRNGVVGDIPYYAYYFSRNLEHVLHNNNASLTDDEKINYADAFADKYNSDQKGFIAFIFSKDFAVPGKFQETWDFIMRGENSLHRHCNFHLLFQNNELIDKL